MRPSLVGFFLIQAIAWLFVGLLAWYPAGSAMAVPARLVAATAVATLFPDWAEGVEQAGTMLTLLTTLEVADMPGVPKGMVAVVGVDTSFLKYGYGLPLLAALLLASGATRKPSKIVAGAFALLPFQAWGICFDWLKQLAIDTGTAPFSPLAREFIAFGYQFGYLVLPTLVPVVLWMVMDRRFLATFMIEATIDGALKGHGGEDQAADRRAS